MGHFFLRFFNPIELPPSAGVATTCSALVYPAAASLVTPTSPSDSAWHVVYFSQVCCFLVWNIGNYVGTATAGVLQWPYGTAINSQVFSKVEVLRFHFILDRNPDPESCKG